MKQYQCHKVVSAAKIHSLNPYEEADYALHFSDEVGDHLIVTVEWMHKHEPHVGGYFVAYEDGHSSYSPAEAFESGYKLIEDDNPTKPLRETLKAGSGIVPLTVPVEFADEA